jgi:hypothetical protein
MSRRCLALALPNRGQQRKRGEYRLSLRERDVSDLAAVAPVPAECRARELLRRPIADEEDELEGFDEGRHEGARRPLRELL